MNSKKINILIMGKDGMVGHTVFSYLTKNTNKSIIGTSRHTNNKNTLDFTFNKNADLEKVLNINKYEFVINCIGELKSNKKTEYKINYELPNLLDNLSDKLNFKLIHISTDDVFPYLSEAVDEMSKTNPASEYGKSKLKGETSSPNSITIRTSFLGYSNNRDHLLNLILKPNNKLVEGYTNQIWTGCTALQFAKLCDYLTNKQNFTKLRSKNKIIHFAPIGPLTKFSILQTASLVYDNDIKLVRKSARTKVNRELKSIFLSQNFLAKFNRNIDIALKELYKFEAK